MKGHTTGRMTYTGRWRGSVAGSQPDGAPDFSLDGRTTMDGLAAAPFAQATQKLRLGQRGLPCSPLCSTWNHERFDGDVDPQHFAPFAPALVGRHQPELTRQPHTASDLPLRHRYGRPSVGVLPKSARDLTSGSGSSTGCQAVRSWDPRSTRCARAATAGSTSSA